MKMKILQLRLVVSHIKQKLYQIQIPFIINLLEDYFYYYIIIITITIIIIVLINCYVAVLIIVKMTPIYSEKFRSKHHVAWLIINFAAPQCFVYKSNKKIIFVFN